MNEAVEALLQSEAYRSAGTEDKALLVKAANRYGGEAGKAAVEEGYTSKALRAVEVGMSTADYIIYSQKLKEETGGG